MYLPKLSGQYITLTYEDLYSNSNAACTLTMFEGSGEGSSCSDAFPDGFLTNNQDNTVTIDLSNA